MVVTLIGYRGSGKSSIAAPLAERLGWSWIDADVEIERRAGQVIREIFEEHGEPHFRKLEREVLGELLRRNRMVIAAGGGAVLDRGTRQALKSAGPVVWLQADSQMLAKRIAADATTAERRPNLTSQGGAAEIQQLLAEREPLYRECATVAIDTRNQSVDEVVSAVFAAIEPLVLKGI